MKPFQLPFECVSSVVRSPMSRAPSMLLVLVLLEGCLDSKDVVDAAPEDGSAVEDGGDGDDAAREGGAASDAGFEAGQTLDAAMAAAVDAVMDAPVADGPLDAAPDAPPEAAADASLDAAPDAPLDAATPCEPSEPPPECPDADAAMPLPQDLRCTGLYADPDTFELACGVRPYTPAYTLWSDDTDKYRFVALPEGEQIDVTDPEGFVFPVGTQLWKEFWVDLDGERVRVETRLLRKTSVGWLYTTYVWSEDGTRAVQENDGVPFVRGSQHSVPSRDQCRDCHQGRADFVLGWDMLMLGEGAEGITREGLVEEGLLTVRDDGGAEGPVPQAWLEASVPGDALKRAALGYLHANCGVSCHSEQDGAMARDTGVFLRLDLPIPDSASEVDAVATTANRLPGIHSKLPPGGPYYNLLPGEPSHSLLWARMAVRGETQMPPIGTNVVDTGGSELVYDWIAAMDVDDGYPEAAPVEDGLPGPGTDAGTPEGGIGEAGVEPDGSVGEAGMDAAVDGGPADAAPDATLDAEPVDAEAGPADTGTEEPPLDAVVEDAAPDATPEAGPDAGVEAGSDAGVACDASAAPDTSGLAYEVVVQSADLETLSFAAQPPDSGDWYLVEMRGRILRLHDGELDDTPFLDLTSAIDLGAGFDQTTFTYDERGLVGLAFAPDYADSGLFYVAVTPSRENALGLPYNHDLVVEYHHDPGADPAVSFSRILVDVPSASSFLGNIHNINTVRFGPDGMLYVGMGDGGGVQCGDAEPNASQDINSLFGKLLRLDPSQPYPHAAAGNPFADEGDPRVLHYGLRNPFRFSFDRATGDLYIGDVGQNRYEELNFIPAGAGPQNLGWARYEAHADCPSAFRPLRDGSVHRPPIFAADRGGNGRYRDYRAIVGGVVYRGNALPTLEGVHLYGDYYGARLAALVQCEDTTSPVAPLRKACDPNFDEPCLATPTGLDAFESLTAIVEDHAGEVYFVANGDRLLKLVAAP